MNWQKGDTIRLIFHAQVKKFNQEEIEAVRAVINKYREYQIEYAFLKISENHSLQMFDSATAKEQKGSLGSHTREDVSAFEKRNTYLLDRPT